MTEHMLVKQRCYKSLWENCLENQEGNGKYVVCGLGLSGSG